MFLIKILQVSAVLFGVLAISAFGSCPTSSQNAGPCKVAHEDDSNACENEVMGANGTVNCCYIPGLISNVSCVVNNDAIEESFASRKRSGGASAAKEHWERQGGLFDDCQSKDCRAKFNMMASKVNQFSQELGQSKQRRSFNPLLLSGLGGFPGLSLFGAPKFPECPVHVKYCYRVPCGGFDNKYLESNPKQCLSDPRCCFDYNLAFMKTIFGPRYMGGAPACYYGATSKQWVYITNHFKPWNPWYGKLILQTFDGFFNTNAYSIGGNLACKFDHGRKAYPVGAKSELQCNLVSGCWDGTLPPGNRCLMASELIQTLFGQKTVYPSLFTDDPSDTKCSANWIEYGAKAYNRMPCGVGPPPPILYNMMFDWCPPRECCLNYGAISDQDKSSLISSIALMQQFGGGGGFPHIGGGFAHGGGGFPSFGFPSIPMGPGHHQTPFDSKIFYYLLQSSSDDYSDLFCPYKNKFKLGIFEDDSEYAEGCCDIPLCYHKKKLIRSAYPRPYPTYPPTTKAPVYATWGEWEECKAQCGRPGMRYRKCYVGNHVRQGLCAGPASQPCTGKPCPVQYYWGQWTEAGPCSQTCGGGYMVYRRSCLSYGGNTVNTQVDTSKCDGESTKYERCSLKPCMPEYRWGQQYVLLQPCSATCGRGYEVWGPQCLSKSGQVVNSRYCPGNAQMQNRACKDKDCAAPAAWGPWMPASTCGATCGPKGLRLERRLCRLSTGEPSDACAGENERVVRCAAPDCPKEYYWVGWMKEPCRRDGGGYCTIQKHRQQQMRCYELVDGAYKVVYPQSRCGPARVQEIDCNPQECMQEARGGY